jgi:PKD repeat protein
MKKNIHLNTIIKSAYHHIIELAHHQIIKLSNYQVIKLALQSRSVIGTLAYCLIITSAYGQTWTAVQPNLFPTNVSGQIHGLTRVSQLKFHPTLATKRYAISARGGLFISTNSGANWTVAPGTDFMPYARLASVCIDHTNDQIIYVGTGDHNYYYTGSGILKSTNGGTTFTNIGLSGKVIVDMIMDPLDNQKIVAITSTGIYKTINGGTTWALKSATFAGDDLKQKSPTSRVLYASSNASEFYKSTDFGDTWTQITSGIVLPSGVTNGNGCRVAVTPADTNVVYLGMVAVGGILYKSIDGGTTFNIVKSAPSPYLTYYTNVSTDPGQGDYNFGLGVDRLNASIVYWVGHANWKSIDGGVTWTQLTDWWANCHTDMHQIITNPYNNNELYNCNDGGVWLSTNGGTLWTPKSDGMNGYEIYHGNCSPTRKDMISIGTQDNGELYSTSAGWFTNRGGDWGSQCAFDYRPNSSMVYYFENNTRRLVTGGSNTYGLPARVVNLDDIAFHRSNANLAFVADSFIYRSTNLLATTPTWTQIASTGRIIKAIHSAFDNANTLYVITDDGKIQVSINALSATPTFTTYNLPNTTNNGASITTITSVPGTVYITANTKAYKSIDYGATWTNITYNLPSVNHIRIIADEYFSTNQLVFVASNNAVYYKTANATTWTLYSNALPSRTEAIDLSIFNDGTSNTALRYASYGRSVWEVSISSLRALQANLAADNTNPCIGQTVQFSDLSTGNITTRTWSFPGGTPATSTLATPTVVYNAAGTYNVTITVSDGVTSNTYTATNYISTTGASLPLVENFEGAIDPPTGWKNVDNGAVGVAWAKTNLASGFGVGTSCMLFDNYSWNNVGQKDELWVKRINLSSVTGAILTFDVAYQVFTGYADTLSVLASTDCGATFTKIYNKGGTVLSTAGSGGNNYVPSAAEWRTETVNLAAYVGQQNLILAFQNTNGYGNKLYLDNVNINQVAGCTTPLVGGTIAGNTNMNANVANTFTLTGNTGNGIQWQTSTNNGASWTNVAGASLATLSLSLTGGTYLLRAASTTTLSPCPEVYSNSLTLNVAYVLGDHISNPFIVTVLPYNQTVSNATTFTNAYTGANNQASPDVFYRFTTGSCIDSIKISTCLSGFDTYIHLLNSAGTNIASNDDDGPYCIGTRASLKSAVLPNTTYYVVVEGYGTNTGSIIFSIEAIDNPIQTLTITAGGPTTFCQGGNVVLSASTSSGILWNTAATSQAITVATAGNYSATLTSASGCVSTSNVIPVVVNTCVCTFNLKAYLEGYYQGSGLMRPVLFNQGQTLNTNISDEIKVELRSTTSPFSILYSYIGNLNTNGTITCTFPGIIIGSSYYVAVSHRNSIRTWSANPIVISNNMLYDFSASNTQAKGNNEILVDVGKYALYASDIDQSGAVDNADFSLWEIDASNFQTGFLVTDIDGSGAVDNGDFSIWEINANNFVSEVTP